MPDRLVVFVLSAFAFPPVALPVAGRPDEDGLPADVFVPGLRFWLPGLPGLDDFDFEPEREPGLGLADRPRSSLSPFRRDGFCFFVPFLSVDEDRRTGRSDGAVSSEPDESLERGFDAEVESRLVLEGDFDRGELSLDRPDVPLPLPVEDFLLSFCLARPLSLSRSLDLPPFRPLAFLPLPPPFFFATSVRRSDRFLLSAWNASKSISGVSSRSWVSDSCFCNFLASRCWLALMSETTSPDAPARAVRPER